MRRARVRGVLRDRHVVDPAGATLFGHEVGVLVRVLGVEELEQEVAAVAVGDGRVTGDEELVVLVRVIRGDPVLGILHELAGFGELIFTGGVQRVAEVLECCAHGLARVVEQCGVGALEVVLGGQRWVEDEPPGLRDVLAGDGEVDAEAGGAPLVRRRVRGVGVVGKARGELGRQVADVRDRILVQRLDVAGLDHDRDHVVRRHDEVVARATRVDDRLHRLVGVVVVLGDLDAELGRERVLQLGVHVFGPVVDGERTVGLPGLAFGGGTRCAVTTVAATCTGEYRQCAEGGQEPHHSFGFHCVPSQDSWSSELRHRSAACPLRDE